MNFRYGIRHQFQIFQNAPPILSETFGARICTYKKFWNCFQILNRCCNDFCHGETRKYSRNIFPAIFISPRRQHLSHPLCNVTSFSVLLKIKRGKKWNHIFLDWSLLCSNCDEEYRTSREEKYHSLPPRWARLRLIGEIMI